MRYNGHLYCRAVAPPDAMTEEGKMGRFLNPGNGVLGALFMEMNNSEMEKLMEKCTIVVIVVLALSLVFALDFGVFHLILK